ncbi:MAG: chromosomal replication initiator protein DnaA [Pseudomonadota bacterium]
MTGAEQIFEVWRGVRARLRSEYGDTIYASDIARLRVEASQASLSGAAGVRIICPNEYSRAWTEDNLGGRLRAIWALMDGEAREIEICAETQPSKLAGLRREAVLNGAGEAQNARSASQGSDRPAPTKGATGRAAAGEEARFTFDTFMIGQANMMAATAAQTIASSSSAPFNPVFFYGGYGVGKTHLMRAIAHAVSLGETGRKALYLTAEEFLNGFQSALRQRDVQPFKDQVRECDVLLIDDVHFIAGKPRTEDEFLHTVAARMNEGKPVVLASHCAPGELNASDPRIASLLAGGFACPLEVPDLDLRRKILDCKIAMARTHCPDLDVPETVRDFLAARVTASARELEGVLNNIVVRTAYMNLPVTMETVQDALAELPVKAERRLTVDDIQKAAAAQFGVTVDDIISKRRTQSVVRPRHIAMYLCKTLTTRSLPDIGRRFGGRDHSTVIHAVNKIAERLPSDAALADDVDAVKRRLRG